jgi:outer membrane lipoprotein SlyB
MNILTKASILCLTLATLSGCNQDQSQSTASTPAGSGSAGAQETAEEVACYDCGTVVDITAVSVDGDASGVGAVVGAVAGGLLGNQVGGGSGKKVATVGGAVGGALAGNEVEKKTNKQTYYDVTVKMDSGGTRTVSVASASQISIGTPVKVVGNNLELL